MDKLNSQSRRERILSSLRRILDIVVNLRQNPVFNYVMLALLAIMTGIVSLLHGATIFGMPLFQSYFGSFMVILLNLLPPILLVFLVYFISGRAWIAFIFPSFIMTIISLIHYFKVEILGAPLAFTDFLLAFETTNTVGAYKLVINWKIYLTIAALIFGALISIFMLKRKLKKIPIRTIGSISVIVVSAVLYMFVYTDPGLYGRTTSDTAIKDYMPIRNYTAKGFFYPFIYSIRGNLADLSGRYPDWYNEQQARESFESLTSADIPPDKKVNVIVLMLEAYADLSVFDAIDFEEDVYGPLHRLQAQSVSGTVFTNVFAGMTIDTERLFLTGNTKLTAFGSPTNSYVHYLKSQGYHTEGLHSGDEWFYDRRSVNSNLGFERYYFLDDFDNGSRSDSFFIPQVLSLYKSRDTSIPYFSFNLSYQNHGAYTSTWTQEPYVIARGDLSEESYNILNNYLSGIYDTGKRVESFIEALTPDPDPVVVLIYGDHKPWLGNANSVYHELGINIDMSTEEGIYNYYSTPYIIWANDAAKQVLGNSFTGEGGTVSPGFLMGVLFDLCSWEGEGYMQALRALQTQIDIINTPTGLFRENGVLTTKLSPAGEEAFQRLRMIELYRLNNFIH